MIEAKGFAFIHKQQINYKFPFLCSVYRVESSIGVPVYKTHMKLTILNVGSGDDGIYKCVAKNPRGETDGIIRLYGKNNDGFSIFTVNRRIVQFNESLSLHHLRKSCLLNWRWREGDFSIEIYSFNSHQQSFSSATLFMTPNDLIKTVINKTARKSLGF